MYKSVWEHIYAQECLCICEWVKMVELMCMCGNVQVCVVI